MEGRGRGGCCITRCGGEDVSKIDRIMLRFRPIAPKPVAHGEVPKAAMEVDTTARGKKRKNSASNNSVKSSSSSGSSEVVNNKSSYRKRKSSSKDNNNNKTVVTLPFLPETPDLKAPEMLSFDGSNNEPVVKNRVVGSWVVVERVTDTCGVVQEEMSDDEKRRVLEEDTCPGFVSDCWNRVWWTNKAYKEMTIDQSETTSSVAVWLVMKEKLPATNFTCRVTVQSTSNQASSRVTLPCDVWRLSDGGFAWRLDVQAALSLGR